MYGNYGCGVHEKTCEMCVSGFVHLRTEKRMRFAQVKNVSNTHCEYCVNPSYCGLRVLFKIGDADFS